MNNAQVRYHFFRSQENPQRMESFFLIINENREINRIRTRISELFGPIPEEYKGDTEDNSKGGIEGSIKGSGGLRYKLINIELGRRIESGDLTKVFKRMVKDTNLYRRKENPLALTDYVESFVESLSR